MPAPCILPTTSALLQRCDRPVLGPGEHLDLRVHPRCQEPTDPKLLRQADDSLNEETFDPILGPLLFSPEDRLPKGVDLR